MSRKHNTQHPGRVRSHYPARLSARGLTKTPVMPALDSLRSKQSRAEWLAAHPWVTENIAAFAGR